MTTVWLGLALGALAGSAGAIPVSALWSNGDTEMPTGCDAMVYEFPPTAHEIGPAGGGFLEDELIGMANRTMEAGEERPCVGDDGNPTNDHVTSITNLTTNTYRDVFVVVDNYLGDPFELGNADGLVTDLSDPDLLRGYALYVDREGANQNLVGDDGDGDELFEPGETWDIALANFADGPPILPSGTSRGLFAGTSTPENGETDPGSPLPSSLSFIATPVLPICDALGLSAILADDFDLGADPGLTWSRVENPYGHLNGAGPGLAGTAGGLEVAIDHNPPTALDREHFVLDRTPDGVGEYCAEFLFDPNGAALGGKLKIFATRGDDGTRLMRVMVRENPAAGGAPYQIAYSALNAAGAWITLPWVDLADGETIVALYWRRSTAGGGDDGEFILFLNGAAAGQAALDNGARPLGAQAIGNLGLFKPGTLGNPAWDQFVSFGD